MKLKNTIIILLTLSLLIFAGCSKTQDVDKETIPTNEEIKENINIELTEDSLAELETELAELDRLDEELSLDEDFDLGLG